MIGVDSMDRETVREAGKVAKELGVNQYIKAKTVNAWINVGWNVFGLGLAGTTVYSIIRLLNEIPKLFP